MPGPVKDFARTLVSYAETRTRLAATEVEEQVTRLTEILAWVGAAVFLLSFAALFLSLAVLLAFWDGNRLFAATLITLFFSCAGLVAAFMARSRMKERPRFLAATVEELAKDRDRMAGP